MKTIDDVERALQAGAHAPQRSGHGQRRGDQHDLVVLVDHAQEQHQPARPAADLRLIGRLDHGLERLQIVAVQRDVERTLRDRHALAIGDGRHDVRRELNPAALNSHDDEIVGPVVQLDDFISDPTERSVERSSIEHGDLFWCRGHGARNMGHAVRQR